MEPFGYNVQVAGDIQKNHPDDSLDSLQIVKRYRKNEFPGTPQKTLQHFFFPPTSPALQVRNATFPRLFHRSYYEYAAVRIEGFFHHFPAHCGIVVDVTFSSRERVRGL